MKIRVVEDELFHADGRTDRRFPQFCERVKKTLVNFTCRITEYTIFMHITM